MLDLAQLLAPITPEQFLRGYYHKEYLRVPGPANRFQRCLPWEDVNRILRDHDVFILQVSGRKKWTVYTPTTESPLSHTPETDALKPGGEPSWQGTLEQGDLLYMPRGWWHAAVACDEPTLHLTVGIEVRTGLHILSWLNKQLEHNDSLRTDIPHFGDATLRRKYIRSVQADLEAAATREDLLALFDRDASANCIARPSFNLPWGATDAPLPGSEDQVISVAISQPIEIVHPSEGSLIGIGVNGTLLTFHEAAEPVLSFLLEVRATRVGTLLEMAAGTLDRQQLLELLADLIRNGVVCLSNADASAPDMLEACCQCSAG